MSDPRTPNDLLANILGGTKGPRRDAPPAAERTPDPAPTPPPPPAAESPQKNKATYYLTQSTIDTLEDLWMTMRKMVPGDKRGAISKSHIIEVAIQLAQEEFQARGQASRLFRDSDV